MCVYLGEMRILFSFQNKNTSQFGLRRGSGDAQLSPRSSGSALSLVHIPKMTLSVWSPRFRYSFEVDKLGEIQNSMISSTHYPISAKNVCKYKYFMLFHKLQLYDQFNATYSFIQHLMNIYWQPFMCQSLFQVLRIHRTIKKLILPLLPF